MDPRQVLELIAATTKGGEGEGLVHLARLPARRARTVPIPGDLPAPLVDRLGWLDIAELYSHQAEALARVRDGQHVVVSTGTASGKTLCYQLPVLETLLADDKATALYLAPTKALARDQLRKLREWRLPQLRAAAIDGDTPTPERDAIRRTANWLLTNPDLLHHSLLPDHQRWGDLLHRLRYVVIDESHASRGVFGSHVALVLRRLRRLCERYDAAPTFILASATIGNPAEHASALTGLDVGATVIDGAPRGAIDIGLWEPPFEDEEQGTRRSLLRETADLLASFVGAEVQTLVFVKSRKAAELVAMFTRQRLGDDHPLADAVASYRAGYLAEERRELEVALTEGRLLGVAATEALELGIDVGGLDAVILAGYPGTIASFWQRLGRAGRAASESAGVMVAADDPLDQYLVHHPDDLLTRDPEDAIVDPTNPYLLRPHLRCACQEQPLDAKEAERWFGPTAPELLADDVEAGRLRERGGRHFWVGRRRAAAEVNLRSVGGDPIRIVDAATGALVGDVDEARAHTQVHTGAVYLHQGRQYEIERLDLDRRLAVAHEAPGINHASRARSDTDVTVLEELDASAWGPVPLRLGRVRVVTQVTGYEVFYPGTDRVVERIDLELPPVELRTVAVWYAVAPDLLERAGVTPTRVPGSLHAAEHAAIGLLPLIALCDRWDIGGLSTALHPDTGLPTVFVYDGYPGGAGLAERSYHRLAEHLRATREAVAGCGCRSGCPSCVQSPKCGNGNEPLDKDGAVRVLDLLLSHSG
ncbi:MAG: DEAD/DEAH box helicase [Actinobacteria bacterium]|nr:DEAD/DEAH box helicase [Actinomycetota bacterium]